MKRFTGHSGKTTFDVIVIGGGITGAAIAYEAASRGLRIVLFEKGDFSEATSAASSKLIHGGLRYLARMEYGLVRESLRERRTLENIAPNFVYPFPFLFPHYRSLPGSSKWLIRAGLILYDLLAFDKRRTWDAAKEIPGHTALSPGEALKRQPVLNRKGLTGASIFYDCLNIFPERLALAFIKSAMARHAEVANYARVSGFLSDNTGKTVQGVVVNDLIRDKTYEVCGKVTINCTGPWADRVLAMAAGQEVRDHRLRRSEGIHIITRPLINDATAISTATSNGRHCFLIPWRGHTLIGTTDTAYHGDPDDYRVTRKNIEVLVSEVNASFDGLAIEYKDILHCYGGLRPLVASRTKETYTASRKYEIHDHAGDGLTGLITVEGGKWTTSRHLAEKVIDNLRNKTTIHPGRSVSSGKYLTGSNIRDINAFIRRIQRENTDFDADTVAHLGRLYGTDYKEVLSLARQMPVLAHRLNADGEILAQATYAVRHEMAYTLKDIVLRRTGIATLGHPGDDLLGRVAETVAETLDWDDVRVKKEVEATSAFLRIPTD
ncbi:MAG: glycerol-3-phosphate dehydrogenase [Deltaproteobacteria bacterium]|nr:MAG: glycerol-3-phosphate dehydrogenase [Deltaproteobacteria bacterium]